MLISLSILIVLTSDCNSFFVASFLLSPAVFTIDFQKEESWEKCSEDKSTATAQWREEHLGDEDEEDTKDVDVVVVLNLSGCWIDDVLDPWNVLVWSVGVRRELCRLPRVTTISRYRHFRNIVLSLLIERSALVRGLRYSHTYKNRGGQWMLMNNDLPRNNGPFNNLFPLEVSWPMEIQYWRISSLKSCNLFWAVSPLIKTPVLLVSRYRYP